MYTEGGNGDRKRKYNKNGRKPQVFNLNNLSNTQKAKEEALIKQYLFFFRFRLSREVRCKASRMKSAKADEIGSPLGQTDPEEKSSAEPREAYKRTLSGETAIENENIMSWKKTAGFQPQFFLKYAKRKGRGTL